MRKIVHGNQTDTRTDGSPPTIGGTVVIAGQRDKRGGREVGAAKSSVSRWNAGLAERRAGSLASQEGTWGKASFGGTAEEAVGPNPSSRPSQVRLPERVVDLSSGKGGDRTGVRREVSSRPRLENSPRSTRLDVPNAGAPGTREGRQSDSAMAKGGLAAHKKGARDAKLALLSSMNPASCCSRCVDALGRRVVRRRFIAPGTAMTGFRSSASSRYPLVRRRLGEYFRILARNVDAEDLVWFVEQMHRRLPRQHHSHLGPIGSAPPGGQVAAGQTRRLAHHRMAAALCPGTQS